MGLSSKFQIYFQSNTVPKMWMAFSRGLRHLTGVWRLGVCVLMTSRDSGGWRCTLVMHDRSRGHMENLQACVIVYWYALCRAGAEIDAVSPLQSDHARRSF